jgi:hypothetical protein
MKRLELRDRKRLGCFSSTLNVGNENKEATFGADWRGKEVAN